MNDIFEINFKYYFRNDFSSATRDFKSVHYDSETAYILPTIPDKLVGAKLKSPVKLDAGKKGRERGRLARKGDSALRCVST